MQKDIDTKKDTTDKSAEKKRKKKNDGVDLKRLKKVWEKLQDEQNDRKPAKARISDVKIIRNKEGEEKLQIKMSDGGSFIDNGEKNGLFTKMKKSKKKPNIGRLLSLLKAVRKYGYDAVAMGLPPEIKRELLEICEMCHVPLKAENQEIRLSHPPLSNNETSLFPDNLEKAPTPAPDLYSNSFRSIISDERFNALFSKEPVHHHFSEKDKQKFLEKYGVKNKKIDSSSDLEQEKQKLIEKFEHFRDVRIEACIEETRQDFFDNIRQQIIEAQNCVAQGKELTPEQINSLEIANFFGIHENGKDEQLTEDQKENRKFLRIEDMPENMQRQFEYSKRRYDLIFDAKIMGLDLICDKMKFEHRHCNHEIDTSTNELDTAVSQLLPPGTLREPENILEAMQKIEKETEAFQKKKAETLRQEEKKQTKTVTGKCVAAEKKGSLNQELSHVCDHMHRHSFKEKVPSYHTTKSNAASR